MDRGGQLLGRGEATAAGAVGADKIGVAEVANGCSPVFFAPRPQIAAGEAAEDRRAAGVGAFALQGVEDLLNGVAHAAIIPARAASAPARCARPPRTLSPVGRRHTHLTARKSACPAASHRLR